MTILKHDWNISRVIVSNKNNKFILIFWIDVFRRFDINLLVFTIYHSQSNDQFERINQTIKIALRYWIIANFEIDFDQELSYVQANINNIVVTIIEYTSNELYYEFCLQNNLRLLTNMSIENWNVLRLKYRENIEKTIA